MLPQTTRLRYVSSKKPESIQKFCDTLGKRIQIYSVQWTGTEWFLWFVPDDTKADIASGKLKDGKQS